jgi:hypothetical protein
MDSDARRLLANDLQHIVHVTFEAIPQDRQNNWVYQQKDYLLETVGLLAKESNETLVMRHNKIQHKLDKFIDLINKINVYSTMQQDYFAELFVSRTVKRYIKSLNSLTNRKLTTKEVLALHTLKIEDDLYFFIDSSKLEHSPLKRSLTQHQSAAAQAVTAKAKTNETNEKKKQEEWLANLSPDLFAAYMETEERINEVSPLITTPEDEYFIEQIHNDYYPHVFDSLRNLARTETDFSHKESVVMESIKQFKIIQLGLQRIMDGAVARNLHSIRTQTDFLMNKVLGENALTLTPEKQNETLDATLEEAQRIREELYKKHVAPVLEKNRQEYEEALVQNRNALEQELKERQELYAALTNERETAHKEQIADLTAQNDELYQTLNLAKVEYNRQLTSYQAAISDLKNEIDELQSLVANLFDKQEVQKTSERTEQKASWQVSAEKIAARYQRQPSKWHDGSKATVDIHSIEAGLHMRSEDYEPSVDKPKSRPEQNKLQAEIDDFLMEDDGFDYGFPF